jgi:hypothetical protein
MLEVAHPSLAFIHFCKLKWLELQTKGIQLYTAGFEVFTAVVMKSIICWDMTPCSPLSFNRRFGRTGRLHLRGRRNKFGKNQQASRWQAEWYTGFTAGGLFCLPPACLLVFCWIYFFDREDGGDMFLRNLGWNSTDYKASYPRRWYSSAHGLVEAAGAEQA